MVPAPVSVSDQATQVISRPHQAVSYTQTPSPAPISDRGTEMPQRCTSTTGTQMPRVILTDRGTDMPPVLVTSSGCQAGAYFDNEVIFPGAPRPKLPWAYTYAQFDAPWLPTQTFTRRILSPMESSRRSRLVAPTESGER